MISPSLAFPKNLSENSIDGSSVARFAGAPALATVMAPRDEVCQMYDDLIQKKIIETRRPLWLNDGSESVDDAVQNLMGSMRTRVRYMPVLIAMLTHSTERTTIQTEAGFRDGLLIGIGLELYRREHGAWPGAIDELVPAYLPMVPVDRLSGESVRYRLNEDGPVAYSVGVDGDDDGGRPPIHPLEGYPKNNMASPMEFSGEVRLEANHNGDWILWPVPYEE